MDVQLLRSKYRFAKHFGPTKARVRSQQKAQGPAVRVWRPGLRRFALGCLLQHLEAFILDNPGAFNPGDEKGVHLMCTCHRCGKNHRTGLYNEILFREYGAMVPDLPPNPSSTKLLTGSFHRRRSRWQAIHWMKDVSGA